jgi:putative two-component system response regulator
MGTLHQGSQIPAASSIALDESNSANPLDSIAATSDFSFVAEIGTSEVAEVSSQNETHGCQLDRDTGADVPRILIVDDDTSNRSLLSMVLTASGHRCEEAADGVLALEALRSSPCDLVLLDIDMPNMRGTEVLSRLRQDPPCPHLKIIMISGRASPDELANLMLSGADDYIVKPFSATQLKARVQTALKLKRDQDRAAKVESHLLGANRKLEHLVQARDCDLMSVQGALVVALADLVAYRDHETGDHLLRLQRYCRVLAEAAAADPAFAGQIDANFIKMLEMCVPLHDIGKAGLPDHILLKPGRLTAEEFELMKTHTTIGAAILRKAAEKHNLVPAFTSMAIDVTRHHHERFDGTGYPERLRGQHIPLSARLVAIADVYDALRSPRVYKPAFPHQEALRIMFQGSPGHFDPALLKLFEQCAPQFEKLYQELVP